MQMLRELVQGNGLIVVLALIVGALVVTGVIKTRRPPPIPPGTFGGGSPLPEEHPQRRGDGSIAPKDEGPRAS
jgi:hypothetical protein